MQIIKTIQLPDEAWGYQLTPSDFDYANRDHFAAWREQVKMILPDATDEQALLLLGLAKATCHGCWDDSNDCQCWNDE